jgi:hypothetical protein
MNEPKKAKDFVEAGRRIVGALEDAQTPADDSVVGKTARVTATIKPGSLGEVRVAVRGGSEDYLAIAADPSATFPPNSVVEIVAIHLPKTVEVALPTEAP